MRRPRIPPLNALEILDCDLDLMRRAIEMNDPARELLERVKMMREVIARTRRPTKPVSATELAGTETQNGK